MRYKLLKDLPGVKAGKIFEDNSGISLYEYETGRDRVNASYAAQHPDFFEPIPDTPKKPKTVWDLQYMDYYWHIRDGGIMRCSWTNVDIDEDRRLSGNVFLTQEDALQGVAYRKAKTAILKHHAENSGFVPDWSNFEQNKWYIAYDHGDEDFFTSEFSSIQEQNICCFVSKEQAQQSIKDCEKHWLVIFGVDKN